MTLYFLKDRLLHHCIGNQCAHNLYLKNKEDFKCPYCNISIPFYLTLAYKIGMIYGYRKNYIYVGDYYTIEDPVILNRLEPTIID